MKPFQFSLRALVLGVLGVSVLIYVGSEIYDYYREPESVSSGLRSRTDTEIIAERGEPLSQSTFRLSEAKDVLRFPHLRDALNKPQTDPLILEIYWKKRRWYTIVWFVSVDGSWRAFGGIEFNENMKF